MLGTACISKLFPDDTKLHKTVDYYDHDLYELDNWSASWQMKFNIQKCKVLHFGKKNKDFFLFGV